MISWPDANAGTLVPVYLKNTCLSIHDPFCRVLWQVVFVLNNFTSSVNFLYILYFVLNCNSL